MKRQILFILAAFLLCGFVIVGLLARRGGIHAQELGQLIDRADRLVVLQDPREGAAMLFKSSDPQDLQALKAALRVEYPENFLHCKCDGTPVIVLFAGDQCIGQITNHHAKLIRCSLWKSDVRLVEIQVFLKWFDDRKIPGPRQEYEAALEEGKKWDVAEQKWLAAMPAALKSYWPAMKQTPDPDLATLRRALAKQLPDIKSRILTLFSWYGSGEGPWSGYASYESVAESLLLDYPTAELLAAIQDRELSAPETEGIARLFAGWMFSQRRPNDLALLPVELKGRLLEHSLASADEDKRRRAQQAFAAK